jgi:hypothetical protein
LTIVSAASGIPATRVLGKSPDGLNASGESDIRNFYDYIASMQEQDIKPKLQYMDKIMAKSELGYIPEDMKFEFVPLWQVNEKEQAEIENIRAQRDSTYLREGAITTATVASQLLFNETYQSLTEEDIDLLDDFGASEFLTNEETAFEKVAKTESEYKAYEKEKQAEKESTNTFPDSPE